ncbi:MAG: InlB B-repeat-containing protein, partial [Oscillospiraceae bacterium]|nr:InlB B-repeat-containing protein [Oscillospiraceae bacterium]
MKRLLSLLLIIALVAGLLPPMAFAATPVTSYSALAAAIAAAPADGTTVTTIELQNSFSATGGALAIAANQNIVLTSAVGSTFTFTQATTGQRHFNVAGNLTLQNVTLSGPGGTTLGGGVNVSGGSLTVADGAAIINCNVSGSGGAASLTHNSTFTMTGGTISGNTATTGGGGLDIENGYATISGGTISSNVVTSAGGFGGGIYLKAANLTMSGGEISNNRANNGGGIYVDSSGLITMTGGTISNNVAAANGGGIFTAQYTSNNPLPPNSYLNLIIGSAVVFADNVAGSGARIPPSNVAPPSTQIQTTNTSSIFGNPLNNLDINYFGSAGVMVTYLTVTFDPGIGAFLTGTQTQQSVPTTNSPLIPASVPTPQPPTNYGFIGWLATGGDGTILTSAQVLTTPISNNTTYVAQYTPPITLIFDGQLGTPTSQTVTPVQVTGTYATALSQAAIPTRIGYVFRGWFTTPNGSASGVQILPSSVVAIGTPNPTTLYAWWLQDPTVTIIFDGNSGTPAEQVVSGRVIGDSYAATFAAVTTPTRLGYTFGGWFEAASGGTQISGADMILAATTLYAQWIPNASITITYLAQGGTPDGQTQTVVTGDIYGNALPAISPPTRPGYAFVGWFTASTGGTQILPTTVVTATANQNLYAHWVAVTVTITFDAGGGTPATQIVSGLAPLTSYAPVLTAITTPTQTGYVFNGWHDQPPGMGGSSVTSGSIIPPTNATIYAWWIQNPTFPVTFDAMGGMPYEQTESVTTGDTYAVALAAITEPSLAGSAFQGWFTTPSGVADGVQILDTTVVTATTPQTLYARWVPITVTIYFDAQGGAPAMQGVSGQAVGGTYAAALNAIVTPTQIGYTFNGWNTAADGTGTAITTSSTIPGVNTTVYAQWTLIQPITVTFDSQGGAFDPANLIHGAGTTLSADDTLAYHTPVTIGG